MRDVTRQQGIRACQNLIVPTSNSHTVLYSQSNYTIRYINISTTSDAVSSRKSYLGPLSINPPFPL